ncbi:MAG: UbiA family prenyltransferase [Theionarchaea archaeon]|nr:UbiA family prenyltransferase [Theionarchaea archaeon]
MDLTRLVPNQIMIGVGVLVGEVVASSGIPPMEPAILGFFGPLTLGASTFAMNDYYDIETDKRGDRRDRPLVRGDISPGTAKLIFMIGFPLGLLLSSVINIPCLVIAAVFASLAVIYNIYLKDTGLPGNLFIASTMGIPFIYGSLAVGGEISLPVVTLTMMALLSGAGREILKDVMDVEGDSARNSRTLARTRGIPFASRTSVPFFLIAICLSPLPFLLQTGQSYHHNLKYLIPVAITDLLLMLVISRALKLSFSADAASLRKLSLLALGIGLVGFLLGTF